MPFRKGQRVIAHGRDHEDIHHDNAPGTIILVTVGHGYLVEFENEEDPGAAPELDWFDEQYLRVEPAPTDPDELKRWLAQ
jgi:hypothetical protein